MNIALIGYGKMGKTIERLAEGEGHTIVLRITRENHFALTPEFLKSADVAIEFTEPAGAAENVRRCIDAGVPVVCGTTGWNDDIPAIRDYCMRMEGAFLHASNFSIGVNIFFEVNKLLARLMNAQHGYDVSIEEAHHTEKKDAPSGTAVTLALQIMEAIPRKQRWRLIDEVEEHDDLPITAIRMDGVAGDHSVVYLSAEDSIEIMHTAHTRDGFARGALTAAEFLADKKGVYTMADVLDL